MSKPAQILYHAHGLRLYSEFPLGELAGCEEGAARQPSGDAAIADLRLHRAPRRALPEPKARQWSVRSQRSLSVAHGPWGSLFQSYCGSRAWLPTPPADGPAVLYVARAPGIATDLFHHTVLHSFVPLSLALRGHTMMHATCVVSAGRAFLFAGESGMGKSTLAAGFAARGLPVFADDVVRVQADAGAQVWAWPGYPGARLRSNSFLLAPEQRGQPPGRYGLPRFRVHTDCIAIAPPEGVPVAGIFFLARGRSAAPQFTPLSPLQAFTPWVESSFLLSLSRAERSREAFARATRLATTAPAWRLTYRRSAAHFGALLNDLLAHMEKLGSGAI